VEKGKGEQKFSLYILIFVYGNAVEVTAEEITAGDVIAVDDRLSRKSTPKKDSTKLGLCVSCFGVEVLVKVAEGEASATDWPSGQVEDFLHLNYPELRQYQPLLLRRDWQKQWWLLWSRAEHAESLRHAEAEQR
jgi:hypothetical protein